MSAKESKTGEPRLTIESVVQNVEIGAQTFAENLGRYLVSLETNEARSNFLIKYDLFNRGFPGGALQLAGNIALAIPVFGSEQAEIASSSILAGVVDEFMDRDNGFRPTTHGSLRRSLMRTAVGYFNPEIDYDETTETTYGPYLNAILQAESVGYRTDRQNPSAEDLFEGLGFFFGSETSGSTEFITLHGYLGSTQPELVEILKQEKFDGRPLYAWVVDHTTLEADHAAFARQAIMSALETQTGADREAAIAALQRGSDNFFMFAEEVLMKTPNLLEKPTT